MNRTSAIKNLSWALFAWFFVSLVALRFGAVPGIDLDIVFGLRVPRALIASAVGMGLAVSGAVLQAVFSNPLCEPYTLGVSSGASLGAVIGASLGLNWSFAGLAGSSLAGGLGFLLILFGLSKSMLRGRYSLLLGGVMLGYLGSSLVALWMAFSDANGVQGALFWLLGDLSRARLSGAIFTAAAVLVISGLIFLKRGELDALTMGEDFAASVGIPVERARFRLIFLSALLVAVCVSASGMIGFIGLVVPHLVRRWVGSLHLRLLPLTAIWGAVALVTADVFSRAVFSPHEIPVGVVTALTGVPVFVAIFMRNGKAFGEEAIS